MDADKRAIDDLVCAFFGAFTNKHGPADVGRLYDCFIPAAVIVKTVQDVPEIYSLQSFIAPRAELLCGSRLVGFEEAEVRERTHMAGNVAQRICTYRKSGVLDGKPFEGHGVKVLQFVRMPEGWRIAALAWDDEREGFSVVQLVDF